MNSSPQTRGIGTQLVFEPHDIGPPDYELMDWQVEETIELLLDRAVEVGERHSLAHIAAGRGPAPYAHRACTSYHAIEAIRYFQQKVKDLEDRIEQMQIDQAGENW